MKLFPYSLIRIGGESFDDWAQLEVSELENLMNELSKLQNEQTEKKDILCDDLMSFIRESSDTDIQNAVQNLRRDLFNGRKIKNNKLQKALEVLPENLKNQLNGYLAFSAELKQRSTDGINVYNEVLNNNRRYFQDLVGKDTIRKGLVLSSSSLLERLDPYRERDVETFRKKEHQIEISLLQYMTRMYTKTSPFSTFTNLAVVGTKDNVVSGLSLTHQKDSEEVQGHIRLNNFLLKYLFDLFTNYEELYQRLMVRNNPTIQKEEESYLYLTNNNNIEAFQRIPQNPVVEYIYELASSSKTGMQFQELVSQLLEAIDAEKSEIEDYVKQLIDYGFLEYNFGVSGIDPDWDQALINEIEQHKEVPFITELIDTLIKMRELSVTYAEKPSHERGAVLQQAFDDFKAVSFKLHEAAGLPEDERKSREELMAIQKEKEEEKKKEEEAKKAEEEKEGTKEDTEEKEEEKEGEEEKPEEEEQVFKKSSSTYFNFKPEQIFYEDTTRQIDGHIDSDKAGKLIENLHTVLEQMRIFQGGNTERSNMKKFFLNKYGAGNSVDLLTFYEDYFREFKKPEKEKEKKEKEEREKDLKDGKTPEKPKEQEDTRDATVIAWEKKFKESLNIDNSGEVNIDLQTLVDINKEFSIETQKDRPASYGCFIQLMENNGEVSAFVNSTFSGYGKMLSRFLHILGDKVTNGIRDWNKELIKEDELYIENCDASYFNANLHPTLMPNEIWMPGGHNSLPEEQQIPILDFKIELENEESDIKLIHEPTGKRSWVFDLGFQGHQGRSQLFQLLDKFTKADYLFTYPLTSIINQEFSNLGIEKNEEIEEDKPEDTQKEPQVPKISISPRVSIEGLIFQRKSWMVPKGILPEKDSLDDAYSYFKKVALWRKENNLPDEVFVYVDPSRGNHSDPELAKKLTRDDYKPQYINFTQPLLVILLEKLIQKVPRSMKIVEMLPTSDDMLKIDDKKYVSEFVMQWYN